MHAIGGKVYVNLTSTAVGSASCDFVLTIKSTFASRVVLYQAEVTLNAL